MNYLNVKMTILLFLCFSCSSVKNELATQSNIYIVWGIDKKDKGAIDYVEEMWLLEESSERSNFHIKIGEKSYKPYYVPFDLLQGVELCCMDDSFNENKGIVPNIIDITEADWSKSTNIKSESYSFKIAGISKSNFCKCLKEYSSLNSETISNFAYLNNTLNLRKLNNIERKKFKGDISNFLNHNEVFK